MGQIGPLQDITWYRTPASSLNGGYVEWDFLSPGEPMYN